jgi:N utilization substance protein B
MPSRHRSRERALQVLFQADVRQQPADEAIAGFYHAAFNATAEDAPVDSDPFMETLVRGTLERRARIDERIAAHSEHWRVDRMPVVDRNILRMAVFEMSVVGTPVPVVIDEALELARRYSSDESVAFIHGVLDAAKREDPAASPTAEPAS